MIVLDGKSTDGTRECLAKVQNPEVRVVLGEKRGGKGAASRRGFGEAEGIRKLHAWVVENRKMLEGVFS